jgi:ATP-binding cassette, subfamily B, bacterial PglK
LALSSSAGHFTRTAVALGKTPLIFNSFKELYDLLEPRDRRRALFLLGMTLLLGFLEMTSVGSIIPFVTVLANPSVVETNRYLANIYNWFGFRSPPQFLLFVGIFVFAVALGVTAFKALTSWATMRFTRTQSYSLSYRLFQSYLHRPYEWFLGRNSSDLGKSVLYEVNTVISGSLTPALQLIKQVVIATFLVGLLLIVDAPLAFMVAILFGGAYGLVLWASRQHVNRIGLDRLRANRERFRISSEALGGIKDIKILGLEHRFLHLFDKPSKRVVRHAANGQIIAQLPQYAMQATSLSTVMLIVLYQLHMHGDLGQSLPLIALYVMAGQRLQPAFNQAYMSVTSLRFNKPALDDLHSDLLAEKPSRPSQEEADARLPELRHRLELREVTYCYPAATSSALKNLSITIPARATVGLVGRTGAGKTTTVDLILGLLEPKTGELLVDGTLIGRENRRAWQNCLGYVPQQIFLTDDTVVANIALGVARDRIDMNAVERAARIANLHTFVTDELKDGYDTPIGERGVRLSGGQRQRIGIARALYRDPDVVIMDEATNALDNVTERSVMDAVHNLAHRKTLILIAHRLTTVQRCDIIFVFEGGRIVASGRYDELVAGSSDFRAMVESVAPQQTEDETKSDPSFGRRYRAVL